MGGPTNKLTELSLKNTKPGPKTRRIADGGGLFLEINKNGSKYWRLAYRFAGKQKLLALGVYPNVSLTKAREATHNAKKELASGKDPVIIRKISKSVGDEKDSFQFVALEWLEKFKNQWTDTHFKSISGRLKLHIFPWIGNRPVGEITPPEMLSVLRRIEARGHLENAHRAMTNSGQVFRYAIATGRAERNPCSDLKGAIPPPSVRHMSSITNPKEVGELMRAILRYSGYTLTRCALQLTAYVFLRSGEIRFAEWSEFDFEKKEWRIPSKKMKGLRKDKEANPNSFHLVPLAHQVIKILEEARTLSGDGKYLFPGLRTFNKPISDATLTNALRRMGYSQEELHVHGFRAMARTLIRQELGFDEEPIERQLGHAVKGPLGAAYNRADFVEERRRMMQAWADYLEKLQND